MLNLHVHSGVAQPMRRVAHAAFGLAAPAAAARVRVTEAFANVDAVLVRDAAFKRLARAVIGMQRRSGAGEFPVKQAVKFELVITMQARRARTYRLGPQLVRRADRILA